MTAAPNSLELTKKLIGFNTVNPPGQEDECARFVGGLLEGWGFTVKYYAFDHKRSTLVARLKTRKDSLPICFTAHLDTVPLGAAGWSKNPFDAETDRDRLYGRGASDTKSGVAAITVAAQRIATASKGNANLTLIFTAGEETCCEGAYHLAAQPNALGNAGAIVVGEPTSNYPLIGHKGAVRFAIRASGVTAHASTPELGVSAIYKAARAVLKLEQFDFHVQPHPILGSPTLNVGTISGGQNINSVPDQAIIGVDIRTIPGQDHRDIQDKLQQALGSDVAISVINEAATVASAADDEWIREVFSMTRTVSGEAPVARGATYFTDASVLTAAYGYPPTIVLGPGEPSMAHRTDEYCYGSKIEQSVEIYTLTMKGWCGL